MNAELISKHWKLEVNEVSMSIYQVLATANDGRRIEMTGPDEERMLNEVIASIADSDEQVASRRVKESDDRVSK